MSERAPQIVTPPGRLVMGSLYEPQTKDAEGKPLVYREGEKRGQPRLKWFFGVAVPKGAEPHWAHTEWGKIVWAAGHQLFPQQAPLPSFAWKIMDGDSTETNGKGKRNVDREGFARCWILCFSSDFLPKIVNRDGTQYLLEKDAIKPGDYVEVLASISSNKSQSNPGIHLNHQMISYAAFGERIIFGVDPASVGFGQAPLPPGASLAPLASTGTSVPPPVAAASVVAPPPVAAQYAAPPPAAPAAVVTPVTPYPAIMQPPAPPMPPVPPVSNVRVMTAKAAGTPYEAWIASNWKDADLIAHGYMLP